VFLHVRCIPHQNSQRCFWASVCVCCRVWIFCPSTVSPSDIFHLFWCPNSIVETSARMLLRVFQTAKNIALSQVLVHGTCVSRNPFS
jgi:hypothetical protein